jgi:hypothetical protein
MLSARWHTLWVATLFLCNKDEINVELGGLLPVSGVKPYEDKMKLYEEPIKVLLNADSDAPVVFQLKDGDTVHTAMHPNKDADNDQIDEGTNEKKNTFQLTTALI